MLETEAGQISVTKDFKEDLDKFMATLTESIYEAQGQTLLYIPQLQFTGTLKEQARDKELTQRLEQIINRWTRQIKEVQSFFSQSYRFKFSVVVLHLLYISLKSSLCYTTVV